MLLASIIVGPSGGSPGHPPQSLRIANGKARHGVQLLRLQFDGAPALGLNSKRPRRLQSQQPERAPDGSVATLLKDKNRPARPSKLACQTGQQIKLLLRSVADERQLRLEPYSPICVVPAMLYQEARHTQFTALAGWAPHGRSACLTSPFHVKARRLARTTAQRPAISICRPAILGVPMQMCKFGGPVVRRCSAI